MQDILKAEQRLTLIHFALRYQVNTPRRLNFIRFHLLGQQVHILCVCVYAFALVLCFSSAVLLFACMYIFCLDPLTRGSEVSGRHFKEAARPRLRVAAGVAWGAGGD